MSDTTPETPPAVQDGGEKKYTDWASTGGPNECAHGYAEGIPCPRCEVPEPPLFAQKLWEYLNNDLGFMLTDPELARVIHLANEGAKAERDTLASQLAQAQRRNNALEILLEGRPCDFEKIVNERDELRQQLAQAQSELNYLRSIHSGDAPDEIDQLKQHLAQAQQERDELKRYIKSCADMIPDDQTGVLAGRIANLQQQLAQAQGERDSALQTVRDLQEGLLLSECNRDMATKERDQTRNELAAANLLLEMKDREDE